MSSKRLLAGNNDESMMEEHEMLVKTGKVKDKAILCVEEALRFKAMDVVLLDVSSFSSFADYFIICSGKSSRQVQGIADNLEMSLREHGIKPLGIEGHQEGHWILMDYGEVIIHIFYEPNRSFYDLESLWSEATKVRFEADADSTPAL